MNLMRFYMTKGLLLASGLLAAGIAATILCAPDAFYAGYGIDVSGDVSLANELKAPAGMLLAAGVFMLAGAFRAEFALQSLAVATLIYLSYGLSRLSSMALDGVPNDGLVSAAVIELAIGVLCLISLLRQRGTNAT